MAARSMFSRNFKHFSGLIKYQQGNENNINICFLHLCRWNTGTRSNHVRSACHMTHNTKSLSNCLTLMSSAHQNKWRHIGSINKMFFTTKSRNSITQEILKSKISEAESESKNTNVENQKAKEKDKQDSWFSSQHAWKLGLVSLGAGFILGVGNLLLLWGAPVKDKDGSDIIDEFTVLPLWKAYPSRAAKEFTFFKKMIQEPSSPKLLPDPVKEPYFQPPYTLVLEMTGVLVHPDWTLNTGWRFKKRPAVELFLQQIAPPLFEVVIYTKEQGFTAYPIINGLDQQGIISFRLFRDATRYIDGTHVKDLDCLNRDLSKVIVIDCDPNAVKLHPRNAIKLDRWKGSDDDRTLIDLASFLQTIASSGVEDVRPVLEHYMQFDNPLEAFRENQRKLQAEQELLLSQGPQRQSLTASWAAKLSGRRG